MPTSTQQNAPQAPGSTQEIDGDGGSEARNKTGLVDPTSYFKDFLPTSYPQSSVARMTALSTIMRFVITGENERHWTCKFEAGQLVDTSEGRDGGTAVFGYTMSPEAFTKIVTGQATFQELFFRGEGDMFGDVEQALKMVPILREFIKEFPVVLS